MWNEPTEEELRKLPLLGETETPEPLESLIQQHYFLGPSDWFVSEYSPDDRLFFGYAVLNDDLLNSEWGYISFDELRDLNFSGLQVDRDLYWKVRPAGEVDKIKAAYDLKGF